MAGRGAKGLSNTSNWQSEDHRGRLGCAGSLCGARWLEGSSKVEMCKGAKGLPSTRLTSNQGMPSVKV
eukprot:1156035-Pelagomonas_calceolata.AAC.3